MLQVDSRGSPSATATTTISPQANLGITKTGPATVNAGGTVSYTIVVSNAGPSPADGAIFTDPAVANLTVATVSCDGASGGAACPAPASVTVTNMQGSGIVIPTLPNGGSVTFTVTGTAGASGTITNVANIATPSGVTDPVSGNDSATATTTISPQANLSITKTGPATVNAGGTVSYTIVVSNAGPSPADGAIFTDPAVANLTVATVSCDGASGGAACPAPASVTVRRCTGTELEIRNHGHSCFLCEIVIRSQFPHNIRAGSIKCKAWGA
jgi:conserved repeat domain